MAISQTPVFNGYSTPADVRPFMKPRRLRVHVSGLRPNVKLYTFFNDVNVSANIRPAVIPVGGSIYNTSTWTFSANIGDDLVSTASGEAAFYFYVPEQTFLVGTGTLIVKDAVDNTYTTKAQVTYNSFNFTSDSENELQTRPVQTQAIQNSGPLSNRNSISDGGFANPLSQTFFISSNMARGTEGILVSSVDLYFKAIDSTFGIVVEIREMNNGIPTGTPVALSRVRKFPSELTTSGATTFTFPGLVFLKSGKEYALALIPDGAAANYRVHTARLGDVDIDTNQTISKSWGEGKLFLPNNGNNWTSIANEFLKFSLKYAAFTANNGIATLVNKDYEFISFSNASGSFLHGEMVAQIGTPATGTVIANSSNSTLSGNGTTFTTSFTANGYIVLQNSNTQIDVMRILSIANNTSLTLAKPPKFSNTAANAGKYPVGKVDAISTLNSEITLIDSTAANTTFLFSNNATLVGADSGASATITTVNNKNVNQFQPLISTTSVVDTNLSLAGRIISNDYSAPSETDFQFVGMNTIKTRPAILASKSNEILYYGGNKSVSMDIDLSSSQATLSPLVDLAVPSLVVYGNRINSDTTNENTKFGNALSKVVTKTVTLADGLDAEDIFVRVAAWRPPNTSIVAYAKILNATDPNLFDSKDWTRLVPTTSNSIYSDATNKTDFVELEFTFPSLPTGVAQAGSLTIANNSTTVTGVGTTFTTTIANGDIIMINSGSTQVQRVASVANNTSLTLSSNSLFNSSTATYSTLTTPNSAYKDPNNSNIVRYFSQTGVQYDTYRNFAIKLVFLSDLNYVAPEVDNIRVVCVS